MRLNEKIDKATLDRIMPFEQWKTIQTDPRAKRKYEREQAEKTRKATRATLTKKYSGMSEEEIDKIWSGYTVGPGARVRKEMMDYARVPEALLAKWAHDLTPGWGGRFRAEEIIMMAGGNSMSKGDYGNKAIAELAKHPDEAIRALGQSAKSQRRQKRQSDEKAHQAYKDAGMTEGLLMERIEKEVLDKIPPFEEWKAQRHDSVIEKIKKRFPKATIAEDISARDLMWAEEMTRPPTMGVESPMLPAIEDAKTPDQQKDWTYRLSQIISGVPFVFAERQLNSAPSSTSRSTQFILLNVFLDGTEEALSYHLDDYARRWG